MSTLIRPEPSEKNKYWVERHRYYELKHFCLQYPIWKKAYASLDGLNSTAVNMIKPSENNSFRDSTAKTAEARLFYSARIDMVEKTALKTSSDLSSYILKAVTYGISYETLKTKLEIPCCKNTYYELYRKFFWLLDKERQ